MAKKHFAASSATKTLTRRRFNAGITAAIAAPAIFTAKRSMAQGVIGEGDLKFKFDHAWADLPAQYSWQITHNVAVDPENRLYVIHEGDPKKADHPSIFVFDQSGRFIKAFGQQFQGGGHGLEVKVENGTPFLYVTGYQQLKTICKLTLDGEVVWQRFAPMESKLYAEGEDTNPQKVWGRDRFMPTNFAFLPDGDLLLADGYGAFAIHHYDADGNWKGVFGGPGKGEGTFSLPHGVWVDSRDASKPRIIVADRSHDTLQVFGMDQKYQKTLRGFGKPANIDTHGDLMLVPELVARLSLLDRNDQVVATLGEDRERILTDQKESKGFTIRTDRLRWESGKFVHPHDACFDQEGNIFVAEWVSTGRVTKLTLA
ncbi:MAG: hypothetical protein AAF802_18485 [Planctomycetota bacterium]